MTGWDSGDVVVSTLDLDLKVSGLRPGPHQETSLHVVSLHPVHINGYLQVTCC